MTKTLTCILCPNSCEITARLEDGRVTALEGNRCPKGADYVTQELTAPVRSIASSVLVLGGTYPLCSVRLSAPIPKELIPQAMAAIRTITVSAPVHMGQVLLPHLLGLDSDVIATRNVEALPEQSAPPR